MFPEITHLNDLLPKVMNNPEIGVYPSDFGTTVLCYAISNKDTFMGENAEYKRECRGITFDSHGNIICRPLHKFFNIGEKEETLPENINWAGIDRIATKHDGSMITPLLIDGKLHVKTKRSFQSPEARRALDYLQANPVQLAWVLEVLSKGFTPIFEWVSPESPIVLTTYKKSELILLQMRNMITGAYQNVDQLDAPFNTAKNLIDEFIGSDGQVCWDSLREKMTSNLNEEGWILQTYGGEVYKAKTDWYFSVHGVCTFLRWRDILSAARDDTLDDVRAAFMYSGRDAGVIDFVEEYVEVCLKARTADIKYMADQIQALIDEGIQMSEVVKLYGKKSGFVHAMRMIRGSQTEDNIRKDFFAEMVPKWSLKVIDATYLSNWSLDYEQALSIALSY